jgi:hypothetical protein
MAVWPGSAPSYADCHDLALTNALPYAPARVGEQVCINTTGGHTVYLKIISINDSGGYLNLKAQAIVWKP